ncbi:hypothetical protein M422DRAFT_265400 [Sphaerobolus stellatus SS14]|uniref:Uncharacterized protein n=1 Tax=Sphaerobolus stellatus (strain SS14) TaxID=990650 RepID=A0A0C9V5U0_SPHS4|nr:hypothetical protein M422DRAFT_265400 [Sphaerobolus stellatus SS14]
MWNKEFYADIPDVLKNVTGRVDKDLENIINDLDEEGAEAIQREQDLNSREDSDQGEGGGIRQSHERDLLGHSSNSGRSLGARMVPVLISCRSPSLIRSHSKQPHIRNDNHPSRTPSYLTDSEEPTEQAVDPVRTTRST